VKSVDTDVWAQLYEMRRAVESDKALDVVASRNVHPRTGGGGGTENSNSTSESAQTQHLAPSTPSQPHLTSRPTHRGLHTDTRFMPDDGVFRTDFNGEPFKWAIADKVMMASACGKFRKCIFCKPGYGSPNGIKVVDDKNLHKTSIKRHLISKGHTLATRAAHAACVDAHFPSLQTTQTLLSTMPRTARVTAAMGAQTSPLPAPSPALCATSLQASTSANIFLAPMQALGDCGRSHLLQEAQQSFDDEAKRWAQERERFEIERKQQELKHHEHMQ